MCLSPSYSSVSLHYFIKSKIAVVLFPSSLAELFLPLLPSPWTSENTLYEIKCTVPGLRAKITNASSLFCCVSSPVLGQYCVTVLHTKLLKWIVIQVALMHSLMTGMLFLTKGLLKCFILAGPSLVLDLEVNVWNTAYGKQGNKST